MGLFAHMRIHDSGIYRNVDSTNTQCISSAPAILTATATRQFDRRSPTMSTVCSMGKWSRDGVYRDECPRIRIAYSMNGQLLNHLWMHFQPHDITTTVRELIFAKNCTLKTMTERDLQKIMDLFAATDENFRMTINMEKTMLMHQTYFTFDGTIYEQVKGTPMGSPLSRLIVEAVLQRSESLVFQHHRPKFWAQYVDDTFVVIERGQVLTLKKVSTADIQFTMEGEENNQLTFLDILVCRKDFGGLKTKLFKKVINTMQVLNANSNQPISHKRSCVRMPNRRVETHCSEPVDKGANLQYVRRVFKENGYPRNFVNWCMRKRQNRTEPSRTTWSLSRTRTETTIRRLVMKPKDPLPRPDTESEDRFELESETSGG
ncbi:unnamed protein product [Schistocephalus solidus]|uniref:Reverse transcriptase domain-containing protein n=1 Tax=Schistocephalus solidus TaxID=70667 RepID=A0A183T4K1_SCHSO|nr:unnamed protein product [Schistocephalus solidus]